jgi:hypothetical protein
MASGLAQAIHTAARRYCIDEAALRVRAGERGGARATAS